VAVVLDFTTLYLGRGDRELIKYGKVDIAVRRNHLTAVGKSHAIWDHTGSGDFPAFTPAEVGTQFSDLGGMQG